MQNLSRLLLAVAATCALLACGETSSAERLTADRTDRDGLIEFGIPAGWSRTGTGERNLHFKRDDPAENQIMIGIAAFGRPALSNDDLWVNLKGKHEIQGHALVEEKSTTMNGFEVREGTFSAEVKGQTIVYHNVFLLTDMLWVDLNLNADQKMYESYLSDFRAIVGSVRPRTGNN